MLTDFVTVAWKEWIEWKRQYGSRMSTLLITLTMVLIFALLLPLQFGKGWFQQGQSLYAWLVLPLLMLLRMTGDLFAGERERHTLETLFATRLPDRAILFGKMIVPVAWSWFLTQIVMALAIIPLNFVGPAEKGFYSSSLLAAGFLLSFLSCLYAVSAGAFLSLRSATVDQANQSMFLFLLLFGILTGITSGIYHFVSPEATLLEMAPGLAVLFLAVNFLLLFIASRALRRSHTNFSV